MGESNHLSLIEQTLEEEKQADEKLTQLAEQVNSQAEKGETETAGRQRESKSTSKRAA
jgi:ferritin-like metal-binding protein YciE